MTRGTNPTTLAVTRPSRRARQTALAGRISSILRGGKVDAALRASKGMASTLARDVGELQTLLEREMRRRIR